MWLCGVWLCGECEWQVSQLPSQPELQDPSQDQNPARLHDESQPESHEPSQPLPPWSLLHEAGGRSKPPGMLSRRPGLCEFGLCCSSRSLGSWKAAHRLHSKGARHTARPRRDGRRIRVLGVILSAMDCESAMRQLELS